MQVDKRLLVVAGVLLVGQLIAGGAAIRYRAAAEVARTEQAIAEAEAQSLEARLVRLHAARVAAAPEATTPPVVPAAAEEAEVAVPSAATDDGATVVLEARIGELESALGEKERLIASLQVRATNAPPARERRPDRRRGLEQLREEDPERYAEIVKQRDEFRERVRHSLAEKTAHFVSADTSGMDEEEQEQHQVMLQLLNRTWELSEQLQADPPREERWQIYRELGETTATLEPMMQDARGREFRALGEELGYEGDEAQQFVDRINTVIDATTLRSGFRGMGRTRGGSSGARGPDGGGPGQ